MNSDNTLLWIWLKLALNDKTTKIHKVYSYFGSVEAVYGADDHTLGDISFLEDEERLALSNKNTDNAVNTLRLCQSRAIDIITIDSDRYPSELKEIHKPPCVLFAYGDYDKAISKPRVTIVGTRDCTPYGAMNTTTISAALAASGFTIVTGVARGIDTAAIMGALKVGGSVIAVLPSGHTKTQLSTSYKFREVRKNGVLLSEHLPDRPGFKFIYHERNRLVSGLSAGTIVTQAPPESGALITANYAAEQNRDVFALVANVDMPQSKGSNCLIKNGAIPLISYEDVVEYYLPLYADKIKAELPAGTLDMIMAPEQPDDTPLLTTDYRRIAQEHMNYEEKTVFRAIKLTDTALDYIMEQTELPISTIMSVLSTLEARGAIIALPGNKYKIMM